GTARVNASKSRSDKSRSTGTAPPNPPISIDIIPGRFSQQDWLTMAATEEGEELVGEMMDYLLSRVMEECHRVYLESQLIPYTVSQAWDAMIHMVEWTFISRDEGEDETYPQKTWQEEPQPCTNDSWAQGCVPIIQPVLTGHSSLQASSNHLITCIPEQEAETKPPEEETFQSPDPSEDQHPSSQNPPPNDKPEEETFHSPDPSEDQLPSSQESDSPSNDKPEETSETTDSPPNDKPEETSKTPDSAPKDKAKETSKTPKSPSIIKPTPPSNPPKNKTGYRPYRGPLRSAGLKNITKSLEETEKEIFLEESMKEESGLHENLNLMPTSLHNILKIQLGRPPQKKGVLYDDAGNVLSVPKLELAKLPQRHVRPGIEVLDPGKEAECRVREPNRNWVDVRAPVHQLPRERRNRDKFRAPQVTGQKRGPSTLDYQALPAYTRTNHRKDPVPTTRTDHWKDPVPTTRANNMKDPVSTTRTDHWKDPELNTRTDHWKDPELNTRTDHWKDPELNTRTNNMKDPMPTTGGLTLENIQLAHGVILREGNTTERGSVQSLRQRELAWREKTRKLQPIRSSVILPSVEELIKNNLPQIHPIVSFMPS
ncbi:uncharacterized protein ACMZJ9_022446, partial [Mantella aurantiaca]